MRSRAWTFLSTAAVVLTLLLAAPNSAYAGSATWKASPATADWNTAGNWTAGGPPNGPSDTATFATSNKTGISVSANTEVDGIVFNSGASPFTITVPANASDLALTISGVGITNNSGITQKFVVAGGDPSTFTVGNIFFLNSATAGSSTSFSMNGFTDTVFYNTSSASSGTFTLNGDPSTGSYGLITFYDSFTAENGSFTLNAPAFGIFYNTSNASSGTFMINGTALSGASGSFVWFVDDSTGDSARMEVFGNGTGDFTDGNLDISGHNAPGVTIGSIEGSGSVFLGANNLTVGANNLSTTFSGLMTDGGYFGGSGGSLTKIGKGKLTLSKANTYTGGTTLSKGTLLVKNKTSSATGTGAVHVNAGTLGGTGKITGAVTVGTGSGTGAFVSPGNSATKPGTLTINNNKLTFKADATYKCVLNRTTLKATQVAAKGVTINSAAQFAFSDVGSGTLTTGAVFTVINNTAATAISGRFTNLANGSVFASNGNNFQVSYTGGTGNDLTLTVVP